MTHATKLLIAAWAATQAALPAAAQSSRNSSCRPGIYLSYLLEDARPGFVQYDDWATAQLLQSFISVPESFIGSARGNETDACLYIMRGLNKTSKAEPGDDASESCKGVLSDECIERLQKAEGPTDGDCPNMTDIEEECGIVYDSRAMNFSDASCTMDELPHINLPEGYRSYATEFSRLLLPADTDLESFEMYDLRVRQSIPFLITTRDSKGTHAEVLCIAPNNVTDGSREPEELEFESTSGAVMPDLGIFLILATAGFASLAVF
ncbi:hypothetical protein CMUS01_12765 [Colletotrichum musicola]|uniref:Uncharacterized protein n=1 Tax=Colletotrichum musicola TaxID=2175873 RepID=A0A8H6JIY4_9PEZI|nr:hypothetical protein CMUS01_12765 [Colletotrichum musicola]